MFIPAYGGNHYVDKNATSGNNDGSNWSNAWISFGDIQWNALSRGDTLFISGGIDSTVYYETLDVHNPNRGIIIARSAEGGYNGSVIIDGQGVRNGINIYQGTTGSITIDGLDNTKFKIRNCGSNFDIRHVDSITVKNINTYLGPQDISGASINVLGDYPNNRYSWYINFDNVNVYQVPGSYSQQSDGYNILWVKDLTIKNSTVMLHNSNGEPHADCAQLYYSKNITVENNQLFQYEVAGLPTSASRMCLFIERAGGVIKIRNNYIFMNTNSWGAAFTYNQPSVQDAETHPLDSIMVTNNTIYAVTGKTDAVKFEVGNIALNAPPKGSKVKNNIVYTDGIISLDTAIIRTPGDINNNIFYKGGSPITIYTRRSPSYWTDWNTWQSLGYDANSYTTDPMLTGYIPSTNTDAEDHGAALSNYGYNYDIEKDNRPQGAGWDIGAYEIPQNGGAGNNPPDQPADPGPSNGALNQPLNSTLAWSCSDPDGDPLTYDVYFGTTNNPQLISSGQGQLTYNPGQLNNNSTYYWKIVAKDNQGGSTAGPVWNFSTTANGGSGGDTSLVNASIKLYIEGPYTNDAMSTDLADNSLIPFVQPYNGQPWNYAGSEYVNSFPENIVDWILVELRSGTSSSSVVARRAAFLRNDGIVTDLNGQNELSFPSLQSGQYYIVIYHRNHLAIMSRNPVLLTHSSPLYDFTTSETQAYGNQPMKALGNGRYGLYAADGNANGNINNSDYVGVWKKENGSLGYEAGDFDLNGGVNIVDRNSKWNPNKGKSSQVP